MLKRRRSRGRRSCFKEKGRSDQKKATGREEGTQEKEEGRGRSQKEERRRREKRGQGQQEKERRKNEERRRSTPRVLPAETKFTVYRRFNILPQWYFTADWAGGNR